MSEIRWVKSCFLRRILERHHVDEPELLNHLPNDSQWQIVPFNAIFAPITKLTPSEDNQLTRFFNGNSKRREDQNEF